MKDKIIFWLDTDFIHFGIAKFLQEKYTCELYSIIDVPDNVKKFFLKQKLVKFEKFWFYHDNIQLTNNEPDIDYLKSIEDKYKINLWLLAYNERFFYTFNEYYEFSENQVLTIIEKECKFFEKILDEIKPKFLVTLVPPFHYNYLFYKICEAKGIKILMLDFLALGYRLMITDGKTVKQYNNQNNIQNNKLTDSDLNKLLEKFNKSKQMTKHEHYYQKSKFFYLKAALQFLLSKNTTQKTHYTYFGRTKFNVLIKMLIYELKLRYRKNFIDRRLLRKINTRPFIYFPLHVEQEYSLLIDAPFFTNQIEVITQIVKSLPVGYHLYVKEHPLQSTRGWRKVSNYKKIMKLPNVKLLHPSVDSHELLKKSSLVISIAGSAALEATLYGKPSIVFVDKDFTFLPSIHRLKSIEDLPQVIKNLLEKKVNLNLVKNYLNHLLETSFEFDYHTLENAMQKLLYYKGYLADTEPSEELVHSFLIQHKTELEYLTECHIKKITEISNS